jgi:lipoprotein-anchoring transpeptidase ErfK/SrfK
VVTTSVIACPAEETSVAVSSTAVNSSLGSAIASIAPVEGQVVGVAHPVVVTFKLPVTDRPTAERLLDISSQPAVTGRYEWQDAKTVHWVPDQFWPAHSTIALSVGGIKTTMVTGPAVVAVANITDHTFTVTVDGVEPANLPAPHHRPFFGQPGVFPASMGRPEYPTPVGTYSVLAKERDVKMDSSSVGIPIDSPDGYLLDVQWAVRITQRGIFVHSAPWAINALGHENVSHGCISLSPEDAEWYFNTVNVGDPVIVQENSVEVPRPRVEEAPPPPPPAPLLPPEIADDPGRNPEVPRVISR